MKGRNNKNDPDSSCDSTQGFALLTGSGLSSIEFIEWHGLGTVGDEIEWHLHETVIVLGRRSSLGLVFFKKIFFLVLLISEKVLIDEISTPNDNIISPC